MNVVQKVDLYVGSSRVSHVSGEGADIFALMVSERGLYMLLPNLVFRNIDSYKGQ